MIAFQKNGVSAVDGLRPSAATILAASNNG